MRKVRVIGRKNVLEILEHYTRSYVQGVCVRRWGEEEGVGEDCSICLISDE